jgi:hypothetical protein
MNDAGVTTESEYVLRRLTEGFPLDPSRFGDAAHYGVVAGVVLLGLALVWYLHRLDARVSEWLAVPLAVLRVVAVGCFALALAAPRARLGSVEIDNPAWLAALAAALLVGFSFVVGGYARDARAIRRPVAVALGLARCGVYLLLAFAFLLPAVQTWESVEKRSKVLLLLDVSPSVAEVSDDLATAGGPKPKTRLTKVLDFLSDEKVAFVRKLLDKNPVAVYRFGTRLDDEALSLVGDGAQPGQAEWEAFARYDFKPWAIRGLSPAGQQLVKTSAAWKGEEPGTADWAVAWAKLPEAEAVPAGLEPADAAALKANRGRLEKRVDVARAIGQGTDVPGSLLAAVNREAANMVQGIVVVSDGRSNLGSDAGYAELRDRATREKIPVFTVAVGEVRENVSIAVTDVQVQDRVAPDEQFKVMVEADGTGLAQQEVDVRLGLFLPGRDVKKDAPDHELTQKLTFQPGEPPHGSAEFVIDPEKLPEVLTEESKKVGRRRQLKAGAWAAVAKIARDMREVFADPEHVSPPRPFQVIDKPLRVLLFAGGPTREYQTLRSLLVRETNQQRAELSICLQSEGGREGTGVQDVPPERLLTKFPTRLDTTNRPTDKPEDKFYNLNEYDLIVAFDPDWSELSADQVKNLQTWVDNLGGGLVYVAGPVHTFQLARAAEDGRLKPLLDVLPVLPDDIILLKTRSIPRAPRRLTLKPSPDFDVLKLDDDKADDPAAGWETFFTGRDKFVSAGDPRTNAAPARGFFAYYPVKGAKPGATVLAEFQDISDRGDVEPKPWLVTTQPSRGRTAFLASGELWRLRPVSVEFYERFWVKLARYISANRDVKAARGRVVMGKEFVSGGVVRVQARLLDPSGRPYEEGRLNPKFKVVAFSATGEPLNKQFGPFELKPKRGGGGFEGYYTGQVTADPRQMPPGDHRYRVVVDVPDSPGDTIEGEFTVKRSDPELDNPRPDFAALALAAGTVDEVKGRVADPAVLAQLVGSAGDPAKAKLAFRLGETDKLALIPQCLEAKSQTSRNRGPVDDLWDKPRTVTLFGRPLRVVEFDTTGVSWLMIPPQTVRVGWVLVAAVGLLSLEWLTRKLLRLA